MVRLHSRVRRVLGAVLAALLVAAFVPVSSAAAGVVPSVIYVDAVDGNDTTGNGSAASPYHSLTKAFTLAGDGTTVYVAPGTYDTSVEANFPLYLPAGAFVQSLEGRDVTVIDAESTDYVLDITDPTDGTGIRGFTIQNGDTIGAGGGIAISQHLVPSLVESPLIEDCNIWDNTAAVGAGIMVWGTDTGHRANPLIINCDISGNAATSGQGGGIYSDRGAPTIAQSSIYDNDASNSGGGIYATSDSVLSVLDTYIGYNTAGYGGGAHATGPTVIERSEIIGNTAANEAGGLELGNGSEVRGCLIAQNATGGSGGGICMDSVAGTFLIESSTISDNTALTGGGVSIRANSTVSMSNLEVTGNTSSSNGAAIYVEAGEPDSTVVMDGCTVTGNTSPTWNGVFLGEADEVLTVRSSILDNGAEDIAGGLVTTSYSLTSDVAIGGTGVIHGDPLFTSPVDGDYELKVGSPCIDTGDPASTLIGDVLGRPRPEDGNTDGVARVDMGAYERPVPEVDRIAGNNRYETAGIMAQWREWPGYTAVLASGMGFADALAGSGLAGAYQGPLLLTAKDSCPGIVFDALQDAGCMEVVIVGGASVVSDAVKTQLEAQGYLVRRIAGGNRYETAAKVAAEIADVMGPGFTTTAFLARGDDFADALASSPVAYANAMPVLLTATGALPSATQGAITGLGIKDVVVVGGTGAVTDGVKGAVEALPGVDTYRWASANRYSTAATVAERAVDLGWASWEQVGIATGTNYPDALAGGALCGVRGGVLLLTQPTALPVATRDALVANKANVVYAEIYGGKTAVTDTVKSAITAALGW